MITDENEKPRRVQRRRSKGWKMPPNTVYVGRPTRWGNPFGFHPEDGGRRSAVKFFRLWIAAEWPNTEPERRAWIAEHVQDLGGKNLACWCPLDQPCHADLLLEMANGPRPVEGWPVRGNAPVVARPQRSAASITTEPHDND